MNDTFKILTTEVSEKGYSYEKDSHDIYFNDIRRTAPEKLRTLIRVKIK